jgi:acyl-CoA thioester hydrolase
MEGFLTPVQVRWSDLDPNFHLRHSVYYDWGALSRIEFLQKHGLGSSIMSELHFGPIIFREECVFKREIRLEDPVTIDLHLIKSRRDYSRWTIRHTIRKNPDTIAAILTCDGAWIDTLQRKLTVPPQEAVLVFSQMPVPADFEWVEVG